MEICFQKTNLCLAQNRSAHVPSQSSAKKNCHLSPRVLFFLAMGIMRNGGAGPNLVVSHRSCPSLRIICLETVRLMISAAMPSLVIHRLDVSSLWMSLPRSKVGIQVFWMDSVKTQ